MANDPTQSIYDVSKHHTKPDKMPWQATDRIKQLEQERNNAIDTNRARENEIIGLEQKIARLEAERNELKAAIRDFLCAWDSCRLSGWQLVRRLENLRAAITKGEKNATP